MTARLDVPALLRRAELGVSVARASCECPSLNGRMCGTCAHADEDERFLARLADAVEAYRTAWDRRLSATAHAELMVEMHRRADAVLALLRGEVEP